jgi:hypothetical protein
VKKLKRGQLVEIQTDDIEHHDEGWTRLGDIAAVKPRAFKTVGWVVRATKRTVVIAPMMGPHPDRPKTFVSAYCGYRLPRRAILRIRKLR